MQAFAQATAAHTRAWVHVYSPFLFDVWQWGGTLLDGKIGYTRQMAYATTHEAVWWRTHRGLLDVDLWTQRNFWRHLPAPKPPRLRRRD
jgi:hypothetical protein